MEIVEFKLGSISICFNIVWQILLHPVDLAEGSTTTINYTDYQ